MHMSNILEFHYISSSFHNNSPKTGEQQQLAIISKSAQYETDQKKNNHGKIAWDGMFVWSNEYHEPFKKK